jgi:hypothetical protein
VFFATDCFVATLRAAGFFAAAFFTALRAAGRFVAAFFVDFAAVFPPAGLAVFFAAVPRAPFFFATFFATFLVAMASPGGCDRAHGNSTRRMQPG